MCMYVFLQNYVHKWTDHRKGCLEIIKSTSGRIRQVYKWMNSLISPQVDESSQGILRNYQVHKWTNSPSPQVDEFINMSTSGQIIPRGA